MTTGAGSGQHRLFPGAGPAFAALVWDASNDRQSHRSAALASALRENCPTWTSLIDAEGLRVLAPAEASARLVSAEASGATAIVIGDLFKNGEERAGPVGSMAGRLADRIAGSEGDELVNGFWGEYVAFWQSASTCVGALRDPSGGVPCFRRTFEGVEILCSDPSVVVEGFRLQTALDWPYLFAYVTDNFRSTPFTGLLGLTELMPGERLVWRGGGNPDRNWAWNAVTIAAAFRERPFESTATEIRRATDRCLTALSACYPRIAVRLSGGLDSSALTGSLAALAPGRIVAIHTVGHDYEAYEARLARAVAKQCCIRLEEIRIDPHAFDLRDMLKTPMLARPTRQLLGLHAEAQISQACDLIGVDCLVAGHGGDAVFLQRSLARHSLADFVRLKGLRPSLFFAAYDSAMLQHRPVSTVLREAFAEARAATGLLRGHATNAARSLLTREAFESIPTEQLMHPLHADAARLPPAKRAQVRSILALRDYNAVVASNPHRRARNPFASQPVVELALRTPAYLFCKGGIDRSLERRSFADVLPQGVAQRTFKGLIGHHLAIVAQRNAGFLRELVLDGALAAKGCLDRQQAEHLLGEESLAAGNGLHAIFSAAVTEAWIRCASAW